MASQLSGDAQPAADPDAGGPPRAVLIAALVLAVVTVAAIVGFAATRDSTAQQVTIPPAPAPQADNPSCQALSRALPPRLGDYVRAPVAPPAPDGASAWVSRSDAEPLIVRCGAERPADFVLGAPIQQVDRVQWFRASQPAEPGTTTWYAVDRPVYVALTLPADSGSAPIQQLTGVIDRTLTSVPIDPAPAR